MNRIKKETLFEARLYYFSIQHFIIKTLGMLSHTCGIYYCLPEHYEMKPVGVRELSC